MPALLEKARAKINLTLHVRGRRADGWHDLESLVAFAGVADVLRLEPQAALALRVSGPTAQDAGPDDDNLVLRAARALAAAAARTADADLRLVKRLPVASGIGGGSADAAATLRALLRLWGIAPEAVDLPGLALTLGADVPVCLAARAARMGGIGETITPPPRLPAFGLLLANPRIAVPTQAVFRARAGAFSAPARLPAVWPDASRMAADLAGLGNDLQDAALSLCPAIGAVLAAIAAQAGCLLARMSGSGATCFGIFATPAHAAAAAAALPESWWRWGGAPTHDAHETGRR